MNYWLNKKSDSVKELPKIGDNAITFYATPSKPVFWIDYNGKIHCDPDAPADETAAKVMEILNAQFSLTPRKIPTSPLWSNPGVV